MYSLSYESNFPDVVQVLLKDLQQLEQQLPDILTGAALDHVASVKNRVENRGLGSHGQSLTTKAIKRLGAYSKAYGKARQRRGRQTRYVDLHDTGDLMRSFQVMPAQVLGNTVLVEAGFIDPSKSEIAKGLEGYYGKVFYPTTEEKRVIARGVVEAIQKRIQQGRS